MFEEFFGNYLVEVGKISDEQFDSIKEIMKSTRVKLGLIAVTENLLTSAQSDEINRLQAIMDKRFGDIAVEKDYLTDEQVAHLLSLQGNAYLQFIQVLTENEYMTMEDIEAALKQYQTSKNLSDEDIVALKSNDVDNITSVFLKSDNNFATDLMSLAVRNVIRFISTSVCFDKLETVDSLPYEHLATQAVNGDHSILLAFSGDDTSLLSIANPYAKEEFENIDADSFDAVCEFINCINGLYASALNEQNIDIDMEPPLFFDNGKVSSSKIYILPMKISGKNVNLISIIDTDYKLD